MMQRPLCGRRFAWCSPGTEKEIYLPIRLLRSAIFSCFLPRPGLPGGGIFSWARFRIPVCLRCAQLSPRLRCSRFASSPRGLTGNSSSIWGQWGQSQPHWLHWPSQLQCWQLPSWLVQPQPPLTSRSLYSIKKPPCFLGKFFPHAYLSWYTY